MFLLELLKDTSQEHRTDYIVKYFLDGHELYGFRKNRTHEHETFKGDSYKIVRAVNKLISLCEVYILGGKE